MVVAVLVTSVVVVGAAREVDGAVDSARSYIAAPNAAVALRIPSQFAVGSAPWEDIPQSNRDQDAQRTRTGTSHPDVFYL
jgi:hypothetical protein